MTVSLEGRTYSVEVNIEDGKIAVRLDDAPEICLVLAMNIDEAIGLHLALGAAIEQFRAHAERT